MKSKRQLRQILESLCGNPGAEDGADPREFFQRRGRKKSQRKTYQLCKQVDEVLSYVLSGECDDDLLRDLYVASVDPAPDASRLMVTVRPQFAVAEFDPAAVLQRLAQVSGKLRSEVAASIHRRRAPELIFQVMAPPPHPDQGEESAS